MRTLKMWKDKLSERMDEILGKKDADQMKKWYTDIMKSDAQYVVFVVRRCYVSALMLELVTGQKMDNSGKKVLTDSAFLLSCESLVEYYREHGVFPTIMLCDDMLIHGRNLNRIIENIEERLCLLLDTEDPFEVKRLLAAAIRINVYCYAKNPSMILKTRYLAKAKYMVHYQPLEWHTLSNNLSALIMCSGMINASYIYSEVIGESKFQEVRKKEEAYMETEFQGNAEYTKVQLLGENGMLKAISTLRLIANEDLNQYRVVPFVFIPNLGWEETETLLLQIEAIGRKKGHKQEFFDMIRRLYDIDGMRSANEWISFILSMAVLQEFKEKFSITNEDAGREDYVKEEIKKLVRNYWMDDCGDIQGYLEECVKNPILENTDELNRIIKLALKPERAIMDLPVMSRLNNRQSSDLFRGLQDYFYDQGYLEEQEALAYNGLDESLFGLSHKTVRGCCFVLRDQLRDVGLVDVHYGIAYFLQLMDAGVLSLSSLTVRDVKVVGYAQFAKAGEQSLMIKPMRYVQYMPVLSIACEWCDMVHHNYMKHLKSYGQSEYCDLSSDEMGKLISFVEDLEKIKQKAVDWYMNYVPRMNRFMTREKIDEIYKLIDEREAHLSCYKNFLKTQI